jgi:hypothetical protein
MSDLQELVRSQRVPISWPVGCAADTLFYVTVSDAERLINRISTLELALSEAMSVRHFCDMEQQPDPDDPYRYDVCLQKWAGALGRKVESNWPKPGIKDQDDGKHLE